MKFTNYTNKVAALLILLMLSTVSYATTEAMHVTLTRIQRLLAHVNPLITLAEQQQNPQARIKFQFDRLRDDIAAIQAGIAQALHRVSIQPRVVTPLAGDYLSLPSSDLSHERETQDHSS